MYLSAHFNCNFAVPQNRCRSLRGKFVKETTKSGAEFYTPTPLCSVLYFYVLLGLFLHRLVGLRRMRLCLKLRQGFALYPQGTLSLDPASPLTPGLSLRFTSRSARCWLSHSGQLCQFLISHSSFLTPHLNSAPIKNFPLIIPPKSAILLISKIARNHNPKEVNFYELYSFQKLLSVL